MDGKYGEVEFGEQLLSQSERALRDLFVIEYLKDFNPFAACTRVGFRDVNLAKHWGVAFLQEPYVQRQIRSSFNDEHEDPVERDKALIMQVLRESAQHGPYASRIQACKALAGIHGLDRGDKAGADEIATLMREFADNAPGA